LDSGEVNKNPLKKNWLERALQDTQKFIAVQLIIL